MNGKFFETIGLGNLDITLVLFIAAILIFILLVWTIVTTVELCKLRKRYNRFSQGRDAKSLEDAIGAVFEENKVIREQTDKNKRDIRVLYKNMESTFQKVGLVKYDAFPQMGGKLSFSLCLLNEKDNGFIMNSVHGTDGCYTYSKEVIAGQTQIELGEEEQAALFMALHKQQKGGK